MSDFDHQDVQYMRACLHLAKVAAEQGEVPVGAVVVYHGPRQIGHHLTSPLGEVLASLGERAGQIIGVGYNLRETTHDPTGHAEVIAMRRAAARLGQWRLDECTLYVTLEPCPMCAGAVVNARIKRVVYGCDDHKAGAGRSLYELMDDHRLNHRAVVHSGLLKDQCAEVLKLFFAQRRQEKRQAKELAKEAELLDRAPPTPD